MCLSHICLSPITVNPFVQQSALLMGGVKMHLSGYFYDPKTFIGSSYCTLPNIPIETHCLLETLLKGREINRKLCLFMFL